MNIRQSLNVWLDGYGAPVGQLDSLEDGGVRFCYAGAFLADAPRPISLSLPLGAEPIADTRARAFFDNLLPENADVQRVIDREGLDRSDVVGILAHVGADCAGALSCLPQGAPPVKVPGVLASDYRALGDAELALIAGRLADRQPLPDGIIDPSPVAGVQRKIGLTLLPDGSLGLPVGDLKVPTTHILKVPRRAEAAEARQEDAACTLAGGCGFPVSRSDQVVFGEIEALLIERFDRVVVDGTVYRLHQEDFAQALGLPATLKYQRGGREGRRFDTAAIRSVLSCLANPALATETFLLATIFNLAIGNTDNHAKNHAILYGVDGTAHLAPLYDLLPIRLHNRYTHQLAFDIGGKTHFDAMTLEDLLAFLAEFGLEGARAERFLHGQVRALLETIEERSPILRTIGLRFFDDLIGRELSHLDEMLGLNLTLRERDYFGPGGAGWAQPS